MKNHQVYPEILILHIQLEKQLIAAHNRMNLLYQVRFQYEDFVFQAIQKKQYSPNNTYIHCLVYNYIKPHESLGGKTQSEEACIIIDCDNKWLTLIRNAVKYKKVRGEYH